MLTARHCTVDKKTNHPATSLRLSRRSDGSEAPATLHAAGPDLDVAVLAVGDPAWAMPVASEPPEFGRVDRRRSGELRDCQAIGFPLWQLDHSDQGRNAAELHGTIRVTEDVESRRLVMRDALLYDVTIPSSVAAEDRADRSPWGGLSGALVFYQGKALGVVIEHHPRKGRSAITILPVEQFASPPSRDSPELSTVAEALGLPPASDLPLAWGRPDAAGPQERTDLTPSTPPRWQPDLEALTDEQIRLLRGSATALQELIDASAEVEHATPLPVSSAEVSARMQRSLDRTAHQLLALKSGVSISTWPDTDWAMDFSKARDDAQRHILALEELQYHSPPPGPLAAGKQSTQLCQSVDRLLFLLKHRYPSLFIR